MAFSIASIFGGNNSQPAPAATPANQGNMPAAPNAVASPTNQTVPTTPPVADTTANADPNAAANAEPKPFQGLEDIWMPPVDKDGKPVVNDTRVFPDFDPAKIKETISKADFIGQIPAEVMSKIQAGGEGATQAMMQVVNAASRKAYLENTMQTGKLIEMALAKQAEQFKAMLPGMIKQHSVSDSLHAENPLFNNPAVQPIIKALEQQLAQKFPNSPTAELTAKAKQYIADLGTAFSPAGKATEGTTKTTAETDWDAWFQS